MPERLQNAPGLQFAEAWPEDEGHGLAGPIHLERAHEEEEEDPEEDREDGPGEPLDAAVDPQVDDRDGEDAEEEREAELESAVSDLFTEEIPGQEPRGVAGERPAHRPGEVEERPPGDHGVVAEENEPAEHAPHPDDPPAGTDHGPERAHDAGLAPAADQDLRHHDREPDGQDARQVDEHECASLVVPGDEGELPEVPQPDGAPGRGEDESETRSPVCTLSLHVSGSVLSGSMSRRMYPPGAVRAPRRESAPWGGPSRSVAQRRRVRCTPPPDTNEGGPGRG